MQACEIAPAPNDLNPELNELLARERGWSEVSSGLTRILIGWLILVTGVTVGTGLLVLSVFLAVSKGPGMFWAFYLGLGILSVVGLLSYGNLMAGQLRCTIHTPERNGARWFIFTCMLCMAMGPVVNIASCFACTTQKPEFNRGVDGLQRAIEFNSTGRFVQAASAIGSIGYNICFILYLRCIGCCFNSRALMALVETYFLFEVALIGGSFYLVFFKLPWGIRHPWIFALLGAGFVIQFAWYLLLLLMTRITINSNLSKVRTTMGEAVYA